MFQTHVLCVITKNLPRLNYVPFLKILFPTSLCGVLVLCLDPAAAASPSASARPVPTSSHNTHHCNTYHISLIPAQLHHLSHLTHHTPLITTPPITYTTFHIISLTTYHFSLITPLITTPLLTSHSSHHARGRRSTEPPGPRLPHSSLLHSHTISSGTPNLRVSPGRAQAHKWWPDSLHFAIFTTWWEGPFARQLTWGPVARQVYLRKSNRT
jgi:hypothetical protein